ncbi:MAG: small multi-drug export protein, partial [Clostridia bacterium]|nr:small multi-drug export protein [Clostridia bacterium]
MEDKLVEILQNITSNGNILVLLLSAFPLIELKGAIPVGLKAGISVWQSGVLGYIGSTLVSIPLFFLLIPVFNLLKKIPFIKKLILKIEGVFHNKAITFSARPQFIDLAKGENLKEKLEIMLAYD